MSEKKELHQKKNKNKFTINYFNKKYRDFFKFNLIFHLKFEIKIIFRVLLTTTCLKDK